MNTNSITGIEEITFNGNNRSHLLIENAPHSNLVWKAIRESGVFIVADSLDKLKQYQDSSSARKPIVDSLSIFKLQKALNYADMLYYASEDTNYTVEEVKDSLEIETDIFLRLLLADLYMTDGDYDIADTVYRDLKVYFREDKEMKNLRDIQISPSGASVRLYQHCLSVRFHHLFIAIHSLQQNNINQSLSPPLVQASA